MTEVNNKTRWKHVLKFGAKVLLITLGAVIVNSVFAFLFEWQWLFILGLILLPTLGLLIALLIDSHIYWGDIDERIRNEKERRGFMDTIKRIKKRQQEEDKRKQEGPSQDNREKHRNSTGSNSEGILDNRESVLGNDNGIHREHRGREETKEIEKEKMIKDFPPPPPIDLKNVPLPPYKRKIEEKNMELEDNIHTIKHGDKMNEEWIDEDELDITDIKTEETTIKEDYSEFVDEDEDFIPELEIKQEKPFYEEPASLVEKLPLSRDLEIYDTEEEIPDKVEGQIKAEETQSKTEHLSIIDKETNVHDIPLPEGYSFDKNGKIRYKGRMIKVKKGDD